MSCSHFARDASKMTSGYTKFLLVTLLVASMGDSAVAFLETPRPLALRARYAASGLSRRLNTRVLASSLPSEALIAEEDGQKSLDEKPQHSKVSLVEGFTLRRNQKISSPRSIWVLSSIYIVFAGLALITSYHVSEPSKFYVSMLVSVFLSHVLYAFWSWPKLWSI